MGRNMGTRQLCRLTAKSLTANRAAGLLADGGGLYLQVAPSGSRTWIFRFRSPVTRKTRDMGLGPLHSVGLAEARRLASVQRSAVLSGLDPIQARDEQNKRRAVEAARSVTFSQCAASYIASHRAGWKNAKHADQWANTLATYAEPVIGALPVQDVDTALVLRILEPIWTAKPETASRLRGRIECVLSWAKARGLRAGENPAGWRGHLDQLLPSLAKKSRVQHHAALPFTEIAGFVAKLRAIPGTVARALEFTLLTAARTNEVINARRDEFDLATATWTIPGARMKAGKEHRVPLSPRAMEIIGNQCEHGGTFVFSGAREGKPISNMAMLELLRRMEIPVTVHGFRSTFRDWAAERTAFPHEVCEMALAHTIGNAAEAAYRRGDLFEKRRKLMEAWEGFVGTPYAVASVIALKQAA